MKNALVMGLYFGGFQFVMPLIGWFWGAQLKNYVTRLGPYISFVLLAAIGGRMIWEALHGTRGEEPVFDMLTHGRLLFVSRCHQHRRAGGWCEPGVSKYTHLVLLLP